jgi:hypothetical protein
MVATYLWICIPNYKFHWLGQELLWYDYLLGPIAPVRPVRPGFVVSAPITFASLFDASLDPAFSAAEAEVAAHNEKVAAGKDTTDKLALVEQGRGGFTGKVSDENPSSDEPPSHSDAHMMENPIGKVDLPESSAIAELKVSALSAGCAALAPGALCAAHCVCSPP